MHVETYAISSPILFNIPLDWSAITLWRQNRQFSEYSIDDLQQRVVISAVNKLRNK